MCPSEDEDIPTAVQPRRKRRRLVAAPGPTPPLVSPPAAAAPVSVSVPVPPMPPASPIIAPVADASVSVNVSAGPGPTGAGADPPRGDRVDLGLTHATLQAFGDRGTTRYYRRWFVTCPLHVGCTRSRTISTGHTRMGAHEPLAFLGVWLERGAECETRDQHMRVRILSSDCADYMRRRRWTGTRLLVG